MARKPKIFFFKHENFQKFFKRTEIFKICFFSKNLGLPGQRNLFKFLKCIKVGKLLNFQILKIFKDFEKVFKRTEIFKNFKNLKKKIQNCKNFYKFSKFKKVPLARKPKILDFFSNFKKFF